MNLSSILHILDIVQDSINDMTPQELMLRPNLLSFCNRYGIEKEWK